jgi:hypothetical protein
MSRRYEPDELAVAARHWFLNHRGPATPATRRVLAELADYYGDTGFLEKALRFLNRPVLPRRARARERVT